MIFNLLTDLVDPDNISDGVIEPYDKTQILMFFIYLLGIIVTIISAFIIFKLCQKLQPKKKKAIYYTIIITAILILILFTILGVQACNSYINN